MENTTSLITPTVLEKAMTFEEYYDYSAKLVNEKVNGHYYNSDQLNYTKLNLFRMKRILKKAIIPEDYILYVESIRSEWEWVVLTESWCGDAANIIPLMSLLANRNDSIELHLLLRDQSPEIMDMYLTNGTRSIPKLICLNKELKEVGSWGPRSQKLTNHIHELKRDGSVSKDDLKAEIQKWYNTDMGMSFLGEFMEYVKKWEQE